MIFGKNFIKTKRKYSKIIAKTDVESGTKTVEKNITKVVPEEGGERYSKSP